MILIDGLIEVYVSAMKSPNQFWIQVIGSGNIALHNLVSEMTEYYNKEENRELHALKKVSQKDITFNRASEYYTNLQI